VQVKASVGATGTMLLLDVQTNKYHVARLGNSMPFTTASKGKQPDPISKHDARFLLLPIALLLSTRRGRRGTLQLHCVW
jgi:hypothetical protein